MVLVGSNLAWCHPVLFQRLEAAKRVRPTLKVVVVDPRRTETCEIADLHLALRPGSDVALFNGLLVELARRGLVNKRFVERHTVGLDDALIAARAGDLAACDLPPEQLATFFDWFARTDKVVTLYSQGVNQSSAGVDKVNALINCHLLTGRIGRPGRGPFSITGQPNAMGGREVGALSNTLAAHMEFGAADLDRVQRFWGAARLATRPGLKAVDLFEAVRHGRIKAVWVMATNPVASMPNADAVRDALRGSDLAIVSEAIRATDTVDACRIRLPALAWGEKDGTVTNSERCITRQRPFLPAPGAARQDWWILSQVAQRLGHGAAFGWAGVADIFREHAALSAFENGGTRDFDIGDKAGISDADYDALQPFVWGRTKDRRFFADGSFFHSDGRARFIATAHRSPAHGPDAQRPLVLNTGRVRDQWHTMTRTGKSTRLAGHRPEPTVDLHPLDAAAHGLADGDIAQVTSRWGQAVLRVHVSEAVRPGEAFAPMHWTAQSSRAGRINSAVTPAVDPISGQPDLKHTPAEIRRLDMRWHGTILARRPVMLPYMSYWARLRGAGHYAYLLAGEQSLVAARQAIAAAVRTTNPGPWLNGEDGLGAVVSDGRVEAVLVLGAARDEAARDRLASFLAIDRLTVEQRRNLLNGGAASGEAGDGVIDKGGGEICACFGVSGSAVEAAIAGGAASLDAVGRVTRAGTNCGSCRPELRALLRAARLRQAA